MALYYIGVDVGSRSVRAGLVSSEGELLKLKVEPIGLYNIPDTDFYHQSSKEIWTKCCQCIKDVASEVEGHLIKGIGFDATCSLVVLDGNREPLSVDPYTKDPDKNIVVWMDHRAIKEADFINQTSHPALKFVGGKISPEMQPPKLLWLKKNMPEMWAKAAHFFDLPDFLTFKATGSLTRSLCSLTCKWLYKGWNNGFWEAIRLADLLENNCEKIGNVVKSPGENCGVGLTEQSAHEMGLLPHTAVSISVIDAYAGVLGMLGCSVANASTNSVTSKMVLVSGTSNCHMLVSDHEYFTQGVWGPYFNALTPGHWVMEGGQNAAGILIDHILSSDPCYSELREISTRESKYEQVILNERLELMSGQKSLSELTANLHVWPDFHGNRSPLADPSMKGMICGLTLSSTLDDLALLYLATLQALAYSTKSIIDKLTESGHSISSILVCGGLAKNLLYLQLHADITGLPVVISKDRPEPVIQGAVMLAAFANGSYPTLIETALALGGSGREYKPNSSDKEFHDKKYNVYLTLGDCQRAYRAIMDN